MAKEHKHHYNHTCVQYTDLCSYAGNLAKEHALYYTQTVVGLFYVVLYYHTKGTLVHVMVYCESHTTAVTCIWGTTNTSSNNQDHLLWLNRPEYSKNIDPIMKYCAVCTHEELK